MSPAVPEHVPCPAPPGPRHHARVRLTRIDRVELGAHPTPAAARRAVAAYHALAVAGHGVRQAVEQLQAAGLVPADTLPQWVRRRARGGRVRYVARARAGAVAVAAGPYRCPWAAHAAVRRRLLAALRDARRVRRERPHASRYPGVRKVKGHAYQARYWVAERRGHLNLGLFTAAAWGSMADAEWAAGRAYREYAAGVRGGEPAAAVLARLRRRGVVPAGVGPAEGGAA